MLVSAPQGQYLELTNDPPMDAVSGILPLEDCLHKISIDIQISNVIRVFDATTTTTAHKDIVRVSTAEGTNKAMPLGRIICIRSICNTGVNDLCIGLHTIFNRFNSWASNQQCWLVDSWGRDCTTSKSNHSNLQLAWKSSFRRHFWKWLWLSW